jgi:cytoskeletal protein RodZ
MSDEKLTLGQYFKREREQRGISLKDIEHRTKISAQTLKFLEEDQVDVLPPRAFLRGFLQVISREFDMNEEELISHLDETLAAHGKKDEIHSRFMKNTNVESLTLQRIVIIFVAIFLLIVIFGFTMKTCRGTAEHEEAGAVRMPAVAWIAPDPHPADS